MTAKLVNRCLFSAKGKQKSLDHRFRGDDDAEYLSALAQSAQYLAVGQPRFS